MSSFVWADLSTRNTERSRAFYERVFGWQFHDVGGYAVAMQEGQAVCGLYETPEFFQQIDMPHFWMSYISVSDAVRTADLVRQEFPDAKVELTDDFYGGKIALIRDPQGAGFTVYDGQQLTRRGRTPGHLIWNELHVSDSRRVVPFYERLFGWEITTGPTVDTHQVQNANDGSIADIVVVSNELKGSYEYWVCTFAVEDLAQTEVAIEAAGGGVISNERQRLLAHDDAGEAFFYVQAVG